MPVTQMPKKNEEKKRVLEPRGEQSDLGETMTFSQGAQAVQDSTEREPWEGTPWLCSFPSLPSLPRLLLTKLHSKPEIPRALQMSLPPEGGNNMEGGGGERGQNVDVQVQREDTCIMP